MSEDELSEYVVEIAVNGTWRDSTVAYDEEEAAEFVERQLEEKVASLDGWGDLGFNFVAMREVED